MTTTSRPEGRTAMRGAVPTFCVYEVDEHNTIRPRGATQPEVYAEIYPHIDPAHLKTVDDVLQTAEKAPPLAFRFEKLAWIDVARQNEVVDKTRPTSTRGIAERIKLKHLLDTEKKGWQAWVREQGKDDLELLRQTTADWLRAGIDWSDVQWLPQGCSPQGLAVNDFKALSRELIFELGIQFVCGDYPGSACHAAELSTDIDTANEFAERLDLDIRFVSPGEPQDRFLPRATLPPSRADQLTAELERRFCPRFGLLPDIVARVVTDPAQVRTIPPPHLQARHDRVLFQTAWDRIVQTIREPAQVWLDGDGGRHVHVLGIGVYSFEPEGVVSCRLWKLDRIGQAKLVTSPADTVSIDGVPWRWRWLAYWETAFALEVDHTTHALGSTTPDETVAAYARWAFKLFRNRIRRGCDLRVMRHRISVALALDGQLLAVARQINMVERKVAVTASQYNQALRHGPAYRKLQHDGPRLVLAYALLSRVEGFPAAGEPLQQMRDLLRGAGLTERCWRMLVKSTRALWRPMVAFYEPPGPKAAMDYLRLLDELGWHLPADPAFMRTVLSLRGGPGGEHEAFSDSLDKAQRTLARIVTWFEGADAQGRQEILGKLHQVLSWLDYAGGVQLATLVRQPGWASLVKRSEAWWQRRLALKAQRAASWPVPCERIAFGEYEVWFIARAEDLYDEARAMRHCVFDFADDCAKGTRLIASVRDLTTGRRVATAMYEAAKPGWRLERVAGFGNAVAPAAVWDVARRVGISAARAS